MMSTRLVTLPTRPRLRLAFGFRSGSGFECRCRSGCAPRAAAAPVAVLATVLLASATPAWAQVRDAASSSSAAAGRSDHAASREPIERPVHSRRIPTLRTRLITMPTAGGGGEDGGGTLGGSPDAGACAEQQLTYSSADFTGGEYILQAGFVEGEVAAVAYTINPDEFPVIIRKTEMVFAQNENATVTTTTHWSLIVWEGTPGNGNVVAEYSSDDVILPHIVMPPGTQGVNVVVEVDPNDPDQIVVQNDGSNTFSIGYRIDAHNDPPTGCALLPPQCCAPSTTSNAFPTTDSLTSLDFPAQNWLYCLPGCGAFACPGGWHPFSQLGLFQPSGDWNIRVTYQPFDCAGAFGACCIDEGDCAPGLTEAECLAQAGTFLGVGSNCSAGLCDDPGNLVGACCFNPGGCSNLSQSDCNTAGGEWTAPGTTCASVTCNPEGACCLPDGSCIDDVLPEDCATFNGTFQGAASDCLDISCPLPTGACCLANGSCLEDLEEANCTDIPGASWAGPDSTCDQDCVFLGACCLENGSCLQDIEQINCIAIPGAQWAGVDSMCEADCGPACPADLDGSTIVDVADLLEMLSDWGACTDLCPADLDGSGAVDVTDLLDLLSQWGDCA